MKPRLSVVREGPLQGAWVCRGGPHGLGLGMTPRSAYDSWVDGMPPLERGGEALRVAVIQLSLGLNRLRGRRGRAKVPA